VLLETGLDGSLLPVVAVYTGTVLDDPSDAELMAALGVTTHPSTARCDLAILGSGPAGLAAAVYAASEGLQTLVLEPEITGGQAGTSSLIRNYLGCISGEELAPGPGSGVAVRRGLRPQPAGHPPTLGGDVRLVRTSDGTDVAARAVVIATGVVAAARGAGAGGAGRRRGVLRRRRCGGGQRAGNARAERRRRGPQLGRPGDTPPRPVRPIRHHADPGCRARGHHVRIPRDRDLRHAEHPPPSAMQTRPRGVARYPRLPARRMPVI
jgi:hypothetical protein